MSFHLKDCLLPFTGGSASKAVGQEEISDETDEEVPVSRMWGSASSTRRNVGNYDEYEPLSPLLVSQVNDDTCCIT